MKNLFKALVVCFSVFGTTQVMGCALPTNNDFPYIKNIGVIQTASQETASAVMLTNDLVLTAAHSEFIYTPAGEQIFIQSSEFNKPYTINRAESRAEFNLEDIKKEMKRQGIPFSQFDVVYAPPRFAHNPTETALNFADLKELDTHTQRQLEQKIDEVLKESLAINGCVYPQGDWAILKLRTPLPVTPLPLVSFKGAEMSGLRSLCFGATTSQPTLKEKYTRISLNRFELNPVYYPQRDVFATSIQAFGALDELVLGLLEDHKKLPKYALTDGMSGGPVFFFKDGKWVLGALVSMTMGAGTLKNFHELSCNPQIPMIARNNAKIIVHKHMKKEYPVYNFFANLQGLHQKVQELTPHTTAEVSPLTKFLK
jgi:hypothetical protein